MPAPLRRREIGVMAERREDSEGLDWREGGVPVSRRYGDPYFSPVDGMAETAHVFLRGNRLGARFRGAEGFALAELGFGTGLSFLMAWQLWRMLARPGAVLDYTGFEAHPLERADMARALSAWPELRGAAAELLGRWPGRGGPIDLGDARLHLVPGDARATVPGWAGSAEAWFLDGFAPARNPEMWDFQLLRAVFAHTRPGGTFATYTAAGHVRRALAEAGFAVERCRGFGPKRHMTRGRRASGPDNDM